MEKGPSGCVRFCIVGTYMYYIMCGVMVKVYHVDGGVCTCVCVHAYACATNNDSVTTGSRATNKFIGSSYDHISGVQLYILETYATLLYV